MTKEISLEKNVCSLWKKLLYIQGLGKISFVISAVTNSVILCYGMGQNGCLKGRS